MLWGPNPIGVRRLYSLVRSVTEPAPSSPQAAPKPKADEGAIRRMFPVKYTPKKGEVSDGD